jgi:GTPase SAR1 family protein
MSCFGKKEKSSKGGDSSMNATSNGSANTSSGKTATKAKDKLALSPDPALLLFAVLGFPGVGRTSLLKRASQDVFEKRTQITTEDEISGAFKFTGSSEDAEESLVQLVSPVLELDTQLRYFERYSRLSGVFVVFDVTDQDSFLDIEQTYWWEELRRSKDLPVVLLGTRADEKEERTVNRDEIKRWAKSRFLPYLETSSATGHNVKNGIEAITVLHKRVKDGFPLRTRVRSFSDSASSVSRSSSSDDNEKKLAPKPGAPKVAEGSKGSSGSSGSSSSSSD